MTSRTDAHDAQHWNPTQVRELMRIIGRKAVAPYTTDTRIDAATRQPVEPTESSLA